ncbi:hypothetical protein [Gemmatimonas sp.]|uniref:helix-turn-helix domain-containing transcriptional regulator n=1 Tax=Gemmatimonas sp. TaxID=1962908 RepID=UPI0022BDF276|nr:hypothetical protein [Gemmatimonas sp.]MCZ8206558.1 hypothetical protein [Gemmatimonas sp.]
MALAKVTERVIAEYLSVTLASGHPDLFLQAIADVAKARGMAQLAKDTDLGRAQSLTMLAAVGRVRKRASRAFC